MDVFTRRCAHRILHGLEQCPDCLQAERERAYAKAGLGGDPDLNAVTGLPGQYPTADTFLPDLPIVKGESVAKTVRNNTPINGVFSPGDTVLLDLDGEKVGDISVSDLQKVFPGWKPKEPTIGLSTGDSKPVATIKLDGETWQNLEPRQSQPRWHVGRNAPVYGVSEDDFWLDPVDCKVSQYRDWGGWAFVGDTRGALSETFADSMHTVLDNAGGLGLDDVGRALGDDRMQTLDVSTGVRGVESDRTYRERLRAGVKRRTAKPYMEWKADPPAAQANQRLALAREMLIAAARDQLRGMGITQYSHGPDADMSAYVFRGPDGSLLGWIGDPLCKTLAGALGEHERCGHTGVHVKRLGAGYSQTVELGWTEPGPQA